MNEKAVSINDLNRLMALDLVYATIMKEWANSKWKLNFVSDEEWKQIDEEIYSIAKRLDAEAFEIRAKINENS